MFFSGIFYFTSSKYENNKIYCLRVGATEVPDSKPGVRKVEERDFGGGAMAQQ